MKNLKIRTILCMALAASLSMAPCGAQAAAATMTFADTQAPTSMDIAEIL